MARTRGGQVIDFVEVRRARAMAGDAVDLGAAWTRRREQLLGEAELITREIGAHAERLIEVAARFGALSSAAAVRLGEIHAQAEMIDRAIANWAALTGDGPGGEGGG